MKCPFKKIINYEYATLASVPYKTEVSFGECEKDTCAAYNVYCKLIHRPELVKDMEE